MKHKITVKNGGIHLLGAFSFFFSGRRARDRGEAAKQFNPSPISCGGPLILMQRYRAAVHVPQPSLFHSLIFWHSSQYLPRCNAAVNYRCRGADEQCERRKGKSESENVGLHKRRDWAEANRTLVLLNVWICIGVQIIPTPPKGGGLRSGGESMLIRACVPKIRAHNLEDISCSTLMVIGERVSSDCCLKDERLQCLSALLESGNISSFSSPRVLLLADTLRDIPSSKRSKHDAARRLPEKSRTPVLWFYQGDIAGKYIWKKKTKIHLRLRCAVKSFVTAAGDPSTLLVQLWCTRAQLKGKTREFSLFKSQEWIDKVKGQGEGGV